LFLEVYQEQPFVVNSAAETNDQLQQQSVGAATAKIPVLVSVNLDAADKDATGLQTVEDLLEIAKEEDEDGQSR
jgi:hypothetical protein